MLSNLELQICDNIISTPLPAFVMGIVNMTPDSFYSKSRNNSVSMAVDNALKMVDEGADILDIGGESSRPGSSYVSSEEEISRIIPVIKEIRKHTTCPISVDTRKKNVMERAFFEGASILNDISSLEDDEELANWAANAEISVILMHKRGKPVIMQHYTAYSDVFTEVSSYLTSRVEYALSCGIKQNHIIIDPGIGFGKDANADRELIRHCGSLCNGSYPVLMALSRKRCIGELIQRGNHGSVPEDRLIGSVVANMIAVQNGATIVRVHDVAQTVDMLNVVNGIDNKYCTE